MSENKTVLLVEDEAGLRELYEEELRKAGFMVFAVGNGEEAVGIAQNREPHVIVLDIMLPGMSGLDVLAQLKSHENTKEIPVVIVSALEATDDQARGLSLGAVTYLPKSQTSPNKLAEQITEILNSWQGEKSKKE